MELIHRGNSKVVSVIRKPAWDREDAFCLSCFCILYEEGGVRLLRNNLTGQTYLLTEAEYAAVSRMKAGGAGAEYVKANGLEELAVNRCIVGSGFDECAGYLSALQVMRILRKPADGYSGYEIFPTTACNARCTYCFEKGYVPATMTEETASAVTDFIDRTRSSGPIRLWWFGGEPLAAVSRIDQICRELEKRKIRFTSHITTNASLFEPETARRAAELWKLTKAVVSLDGDRASYAARKRYIDPRRHNFDAALRGIRLLNEQGVSVELRCNYDGDNLDGLTGFVDEIHREFPDARNIQLRFAVLHQEYAQGTAPELIRKVRPVEDRAAALGLIHTEQLSLAGFRTYACIADDPARGVVIEPGGQLQHCDHLSDENRFGNIWEGITDRQRYEELKRLRPVEEACKRCPFLPECTPFRKTGCPLRKSDGCRGFVQAMAENVLHRVAADLQAGKEGNA